MTGKNEHNDFGDGEKAPSPCKNPEKGGRPHSGSQDVDSAFEGIAYAARTDSIKKLIEDFGSRHLTPEYVTFAFNLCDKISITPDLDILRGQRTIWAASIVHVIARLNFLFDSSSEHVLTPALICAHFNTNKSTVSNRASRIQKICAIAPGTRGYCRQEIVDAVAFHETVDGFVLPAKISGKPSASEERRKNPAMRILAYRRRQEAENRRLQALLEERKKSSRANVPMAPDDKQLKLFE